MKFEKNVNGYKLMIGTSNGRPDIFLANGDNEISISIAGVFESYEHIRSQSYSLIEFEIQTKSVGSKSALGIKKLIQQYQKAVEAVEAFEVELYALELSEQQVSE